MRQFVILFLMVMVSHHWVKAQEVFDTDKLLNDLKTLSADSMEGREPGTAGHAKAGKYIVDRFREIGLASFKDSYAHHFDLSFKTVNKGTNYIGYIAGLSEKCIVVTANYDNLGAKDNVIYNGADGNGSGVAAMMAMAAYFKQNPPYHTIIFAALDAKNLDFAGSNAFIDSPPVKFDHLRLNINLDMISISDKNEIYVVGTRQFPYLKKPIETATAEKPIAFIFGNDGRDIMQPNWLYASDHAPFYRNGIPFAFFGVEEHEHYRSPTDKFENIHKEFYTKVVGLIIQSADNLDKSFDRKGRKMQRARLKAGMTVEQEGKVKEGNWFTRLFRFGN
jgi:hypothetical protein